MLKPFSLERWDQYIFDNNWQLAMLFIDFIFFMVGREMEISALRYSELLCLCLTSQSLLNLQTRYQLCFYRGRVSFYKLQLLRSREREKKCDSSTTK